MYNSGEKEILYQRNSKFYVIEVEKQKEITDIYLKEA